MNYGLLVIKYLACVVIGKLQSNGISAVSDQLLKVVESSSRRENMMWVCKVEIYIEERRNISKTIYSSVVVTLPGNAMVHKYWPSQSLSIVAVLTLKLISIP